LAETDFETDDGRTGAGADASNKRDWVFMRFFLKPLSVRLPYAARFTWAEPNFAARSAEINNSAEAKSVTVSKGESGDTGAVLAHAATVKMWRSSEQQAEDGSEEGGQTKGAMTNTSTKIPDVTLGHDASL